VVSLVRLRSTLLTATSTSTLGITARFVGRLFLFVTLEGLFEILFNALSERIELLLVA